VNVVFSVDLFNEGVDVPAVDTLLMLRPTDSPVLFVQQLGRGLRKANGKALCTVLDFVGLHRREFRFDRRLGALLGGSRRHIEEQVRRGFPFLPAGCQMQLEPKARERILESIRQSVPTRRAEWARELAALAAQRPAVTLGEYLKETGLALEEFYANPADSWTALRVAARLPVAEPGPQEATVRTAIGRLLHVDDHERLTAWRQWLRAPHALDVDATGRDACLVRMLLAQLLERVPSDGLIFSAGAALLREHPAVCAELVALCDVLAQRVAHRSVPLSGFPGVPLRVHARYSRREILVACGESSDVKGSTWREGVRFADRLPADLFVFTLDKTKGQFSPTTRYRDYAISRELIHWESQSTTRAGSPTGLRYQQHAQRGSHIWLFARLNASMRSPVTCSRRSRRRWRRGEHRTRCSKRRTSPSSRNGSDLVTGVRVTRDVPTSHIPWRVPSPGRISALLRCGLAPVLPPRQSRSIAPPTPTAYDGCSALAGARGPPRPSC